MTLLFLRRPGMGLGRANHNLSSYQPGPETDEMSNIPSISRVQDKLHRYLAELLLLDPSLRAAVFPFRAQNS